MGADSSRWGYGRGGQVAAPPLAHRPHMTQSQLPGEGPQGRLWFLPPALSPLFFVATRAENKSLGRPGDNGALSYPVKCLNIYETVTLAAQVQHTCRACGFQVATQPSEGRHKAGCLCHPTHPGHIPHSLSLSGAARSPPWACRSPGAGGTTPPL